jgi:hypothetical protein
LFGALIVEPPRASKDRDYTALLHSRQDNAVETLLEGFFPSSDAAGSHRP